MSEKKGFWRWLLGRIKDPLSWVLVGCILGLLCLCIILEFLLQAALIFFPVPFNYITFICAFIVIILVMLYIIYKDSDDKNG